MNTFIAIQILIIAGVCNHLSENRCNDSLREQLTTEMIQSEETFLVNCSRKPMPGATSFVFGKSDRAAPKD